MKEIWKNIEEYPGYQVSNLGRIRTYNKVTYTDFHGKRIWKNRIIKPKISKKDKCARVELWKDGKHKTVLVHRLVANAFLKKYIDTNITVNHIDGNRLNNNIDNLEWMSRSDNIKYGFNNNQYDNICRKCILEKNGKKYIFRSCSEASKFLNRNKNYVSMKINKNEDYCYNNKNEKYKLKPF